MVYSMMMRLLLLCPLSWQELHPMMRPMPYWWVVSTKKSYLGEIAPLMNHLDEEVH
jgi:hypothetical protein